LTVDDGGRWTGLSDSQFAASLIEDMMQAIQRAVVTPTAEIVVPRAPRRRLLRDRRPLATSAQDTHQSVDHLTHIDRSLITPALGPSDLLVDQRPFFVRQIARMARFAAVMASSVFLRPHPQNLPNRTEPHQITNDSTDSICHWIDTKPLF
jgi:hypothetical protein